MSVQEWNRNYDQQKQDGVIESITSAYNFVPLSETIVFPDWDAQVSQDYPFADGVCGTLQLTINSHSPLLVGTKQDREVKPFYLPDGTAAIPGSSLRGMIRNVLEIAGFGKMRLADDRRYSIRDLTPGAKKIYRDKFANEGGSKSGWLFFNSDKQAWTITPCQYTRIEKDILQKAKKGWLKLLTGEIDCTHKEVPKTDRVLPTAQDKYRFWQKNNLTVGFESVHQDDEHSKNTEKTISKTHRIKFSNIGRDEEVGFLVFTGQPNEKKQKEFVFYNEEPSQNFTVPDPIMRDFQHIYAESSHWEFLKNEKLFPIGFPVFYLTQKDKITSLGLSQMYRLAYQQSIGEIIDHANGGHRQNNRPDLAELIFGTIDEKDGKESLKGRVSFSHAVCQTPPPYREQACTAILNSPKPTYYPNYVVQDEEDGKLKGRDYRTYMDANAHMDANAQIRGWKRYPVKTAITLPQLDRDQLAGGAWSKLHPLDGPLSFQTKLRFHNLRPVELGAIAWCLDWGGNPALRHSIGMGKPFGFGQISISVNEQDLRPNKPDTELSLQDCVAAFTRFMDESIGQQWLSSVNMQHLLAMADPCNADGRALIPLDLCGGGRNNQFVNAKKASLVLEPYIVPKAPELSGEVKWLEANLAELAKQNRSQPEKELLAKGLAERWQALTDNEEKSKIRALIKQRWQGWWAEPNGKSMITARKIYEEIL